MINDMKKRSYHSPRREEQAENTRAAIVAALVEQLYEQGLSDFSVPRVARRAGVSTRTVYRYFPTREDLIEGVEAHLRQVAPDPQPPRSFDELPGFTAVMFDYFDRHQQLLAVSEATSLGREVHGRMRARRMQATLDELERSFPEAGADPRERLKAFAVVRVLLSSRAWRLMTQEIGLGQQEAIDAVTDAITVLQHAAREQSHD
jgi:AcrR family transcriptional regulator